MSRILAPGEPAPWLFAPVLSGNPRFAFDTAAGRWIVLLLMGSGAQASTKAALGLVRSARGIFDDQRACFFGVTIDPSDAHQGRIAQHIPGIRWFLDYDRKFSARFGAVDSPSGSAYRPHWLLLDPMFRVHSRAPLDEGPAILQELSRQLALPSETASAPVLTVPQVLPPDMCQALIALYDRRGGDESGFMREENGITVHRIDHSHKRRADCTIDEEPILASLKSRLSHVLRPMILRAFQFDASRIERFIVARYDGATGGYFRPHRDNTTKGTAHRKFACTINLNAEDYEGGDLCFPEFGQRTYRAPTGGAVVFSCSLLHEAQPVTTGHRYAFLPFFYDDEGARLRERNLQFVGAEFQGYRSGLPPSNQPAATQD